jgi:hypothetical protein
MGNSGSATVNGGGKKGGKPKSKGGGGGTHGLELATSSPSPPTSESQSVFRDDPMRLEPNQGGSTSSSDSSDNFDDEPSLELFSSTKVGVLLHTLLTLCTIIHISTFSFPLCVQSDMDLSSFRSDLGSTGSKTEDDSSYRRNYLDSVKRGNLIGQGSFGKVFMGLNQVTGELLAVKQVHLEMTADNNFVKSKEVRKKERKPAIYLQYPSHHCLSFLA